MVCRCEKNIDEATRSMFHGEMNSRKMKSCEHVRSVKLTNELESRPRTLALIVKFTAVEFYATVKHRSTRLFFLFFVKKRRYLER